MTFAKALADLGANGVPGALPSINRLVTIPTDYPNLQAAFDGEKARAYNNFQIEIRIASGHVLTDGALLEDGDYTNFRVTSVSSVVNCSAGFTINKPIISLSNAKGPRVSVLFNCNSRANGFLLNKASSITIDPGAGARYSYGTGLQANGGSYACARGTDFTFAAQNGNTGAAITAWGSIVDCETANCDDSAYYGVQAAHGGIVNFRQGTARRATRYGVRATDAGILDFDGGDASSCGRIGIYAFNASHINAVDATATGCGGGGSGGGNLAATQGSTINAVGATLAPGGLDYAILCTTLGRVNASNAVTRRFGSANPNDMQVSTGGQINASGTIGGTNVTVNTLTAAGMILR